MILTRQLAIGLVAWGVLIVIAGWIMTAASSTSGVHPRNYIVATVITAGSLPLLRYLPTRAVLVHMTCTLLGANIGIFFLGDTDIHALQIGPLLVGATLGSLSGVAILALSKQLRGDRSRRPGAGSSTLVGTEDIAKTAAKKRTPIAHWEGVSKVSEMHKYVVVELRDGGSWLLFGDDERPANTVVPPSNAVLPKLLNSGWEPIREIPVGGGIAGLLTGARAYCLVLLRKHSNEEAE